MVMGDHNTTVLEVDGRAYAVCKSCGWQTGWMTPDEAWKCAEEHAVGLPV
jgi:hypothetical protein